MTEQSTIPKHLGFILDGNRRWAKKHGLPTYEGHLAGYSALKEVIIEAVDRGVQYVSVYVFSTENWKRSEEEVSGLMSLAMRVFKTDIKALLDKQIRLKILGSREGVPKKLLEAMDSATEQSKDFTRGTVAICFNYGGHQEIIEAVQACGREGIAAADITEEAIRAHLYEPDIPDVDLVVRTSAEQRISNFMLWRVAYSEFMFMDKLWPDMRAADVDDIIKEYNRRNRRFGGN